MEPKDKRVNPEWRRAAICAAVFAAAFELVRAGVEHTNLFLTNGDVDVVELVRPILNRLAEHGGC